MKKSLAGLVIVLICLVIVQNRLFNKKSMDIAANAFEAGCLTEGKEVCVTQYSKPDDYTVNLRNLCFEFMLTDCQKKTIDFYNWMVTKK